MESYLFPLDGREEFALSIVKKINEYGFSEKTELGKIAHQTFSDGELCVEYLNSVRGKRVYLLSTPCNSNELLKLIFAINAAKINGAKEIIPIIPYMPYARQDRKSASRSGISAKTVATMIEKSGATTLITFDLHALQIEGFFDIPIIHIEGKDVFSEYLSKNTNENTILASPDAGGVKRVKKIRDNINNLYSINLNYVTMDKTRTKANEVDHMIVIGDVTGKDVIIIDDIIDTFGTADKAINLLLEHNAKSVSMVVSRGVLSGPAIERINKSKITTLVVSDSLHTSAHSNIKTISVVSQISKAILSINMGRSYENFI